MKYLKPAALYVCLFCVFLCASCALIIDSDLTDHDIREYADFSARGVSRIEVETSVVDVTVVSCHGDRIRFILTGSDSCSSVDFDTKQSGGIVSVSCDPEKPNAKYGHKLSLEVQVPDFLAPEFTIKNITGKIDFQYSGAERLCLSTSSGSIKIDSADVYAAAELRSNSGGISAGSLSAPRLNIINSSGSVSVSGLNVRNISIKNTSGSVTAAAFSLPDDLEIANTSGSITVTLPGDSSFFVDARSNSGRVECDFSVDGTAERRKVRGIVGAAKECSSPSVYLESVSGSVKIRKGGSAGNTCPAEETAA
ncbi:DUF4097 family beta strand repeat-containing protein [Breznakiella homolactica]|uniref:DUF4097 family beta strand repeat protein n=1 Tax=Breznakiella homolactica TaxID=2798577 RepID=A0A7T7XR26_9SPIR|nr:DUF4097 family beta strand repeat-containing protein [Breznakiella homolactica]QQO10935.1 DUF4097 domain-containing protein [Breznakiella homolactica]